MAKKTLKQLERAVASAEKLRDHLADRLDATKFGSAKHDKLSKLYRKAKDKLLDARNARNDHPDYESPVSLSC